MSKALCHQIASLLEHKQARKDEVAYFFGAERVRALWKTIAFMRRCLRIEIEEMSIRVGLPRSRRSDEPFSGRITRANWGETLLLFSIYESGWLPQDARHLRYLLYRASSNYFYSKFLVDIQARIEAADAVEAVASILRRQ